MTETDYLRVRALSIIMAANSQLRDIMPSTLEEIDKEEYKTVMRILLRWKDKLFENIKPKPEE